MKISKVSIQNFRGFQEESIELDDITVFVGENNTGKSTILDAIRLAIGTKYWNESLNRYDYHLSSPTSHAGDAGQLLIRIEVSEKNEDDWPNEIQQTLPDSIELDNNGLRHFYMTLKGTYNKSEEKSTDTKEFQNKSDISKSTKANTSKCFSDFKKFLPVFYINSLRDATKEFKQKKGLFSTFLSSEIIQETKRNELETKMRDLNNEILDVLVNMKSLKDNLKKSMNILSDSDESTVDIESFPSDISNLIEKAGVILKSKTGIRLPLERHGSGTQSLSVLFLYEAFLSVLLTTEYDKFSKPILLIEEPEAHLHPSAVRIFWRFLDKMPGQKIITTHSGDIISSVPFSKIRKITGTTGKNRVKAMSDSMLNDKEKRILRNYIMYSRGELFFAKLWLIVEGETEQAFFDNLLNKDGFLDKKGIRIIQYTQLNLDILLKLAQQINTRWFLISDGDQVGQGYKQKAIHSIPDGESQDEYIYSFSEPTIEVHLMANNFDTFYTSKLSHQTSSKVSGQAGSLEYYKSVYQAIKKSISKPEIILEVVDAINNGFSPPPPLLNEIKLKLEAIE